MIEEVKIGDKFGSLLVIKQGEDYSYPNSNKKLKRWICQCDCKKQSLYYQKRLLSGKSKMCKSCAAKTTKRIEGDLVGHKFGFFTVIQEVDRPDKIKSKGRYWLCRCKCGNERIISTSEINREGYLSCGCGRNKNVYDLSGSYGIGYTNNGERFYFDIEDYNLIKDYTWSKTANGYLITFIKGSNNEFIYQHRLIVGLNKNDNYDVDHENHKIFDNRKENLRVCTHQNNIRNSKLSKNNTSGVTGVYFNTQIEKWSVTIVVDYQTIHLGSFENFQDAVSVRKKAEEKYFGEYAYKGGNNNEV